MKETHNILLQKSLKLLIIGDGCRDYNHYGNVNRISQEAPVPIFDLAESEYKLGMTYNVAENFKNLGVSNISLQTYVIENKHRYIDKKSNQQVYRIDEKVSGNKTKLDYSGEYDAVVISDYDKGTLSYEEIEEIINSFAVPVFIDTKKTDLSRFKNCVVKINETEYLNSTSLPDNLIVTRSDKDVIVLRKGKVVSQHEVQKVQLHDATGAGDSFLAAFVVYYLISNDFNRSIDFAITSSQITVTKFGVYAPRLEEICQQD